MKPLTSKFGFDFSGASFEHKPWISWLLLPSLYLMTVYVFFKKMYFMKFFGKMPPVNTMFFDGLSKYPKHAAKNPGSWKTISNIYILPEESKFTISFLIHSLAFVNTNCQSVRNRLRIIKMITSQIMQSELTNNILCLACGSAESILPEFLAGNGNHCNSLTLVDNCCDAVGFLNGRIKDSSCSDKINVVHKAVGEFIESNKDEYDLVEMVGLLEYIDDKTALEILRGVRELMSDDAFFIASNIKRNMETPFVKWVINWEMIYRTPEQLAKLIADAGFDDFEVIVEPLGIHSIVVARKR